MVGESCKEVIQGKKHRLTNTELKLADYILEHYDEALNYNVTELADSAGVSDASVVRFCKKLGYKGYQDFKVNVAKDVLPRDRHFNPGLEQDDDIETICKKIFLSEVNVLNRTLASLDTNELKVVAEKIEKAEKIVFFGSGGSLIVAKDAAHKFMKIGIRAFVYEDIDLQLMSSSLMSEKEVAIGISYSGSNRNVIDCIKNAKENGAETIAIVGQGKTPLSKIADMILYCSSEETMFESESVSTRIAQLAIIDAIVAIVAFDNYEESYTAIQRTRRATSENKY